MFDDESKVLLSAQSAGQFTNKMRGVQTLFCNYNPWWLLPVLCNFIACPLPAKLDAHSLNVLITKVSFHTLPLPGSLCAPCSGSIPLSVCAAAVATRNTTLTSTHCCCFYCDYDCDSCWYFLTLSVFLSTFIDKQKWMD